MMSSRRKSAFLAAAALAVALPGCEFPDAYGPVRQPSGSGLLVRRETPPYEVRGRGNVGALQIASFARTGGDHDPDISPDGAWMVFSSTRHSRRPGIYLKSVTGTAVRQRTTGPASYIQPKFSPDGRQIACASDESGNWDIWIIGRDERWAVNLTDSPEYHEIHPSWHPDPKVALVIFNRRNPATGGWEIWARSRRGGGATKLTDGLFPEWSPASTAAGGSICFQRARRRGRRWFSIWTVDATIDAAGHIEVGLPTEIVASDRWAAIQPGFSPDGGKLVFATVHRSPAAVDQRRVWEGDDIWCVNLDGTDLQRLTVSPEADWNPVWARRAKGVPGRVYFCSEMSGHKNIWSLMPALPDVPREILPNKVTEADEAKEVIRRNLADQEKAGKELRE